MCFPKHYLYLQIQNLFVFDHLTLYYLASCTFYGHPLLQNHIVMRMGYAPVVGVLPHKPDVELTTIMMFVQVPRFNLLQGQPPSCIPIIARFFLYGIQMVPRTGGDRYARGAAAPVVDTGGLAVYRRKLCEKDAAFMSGW